MDPTTKNILIDSISSRWKTFANCTQLHAAIGYIDINFLRDEIKMEELLSRLVEVCPSSFMNVIEKALKVMDETDVWNKIDLHSKCNEIFINAIAFISIYYIF